MKRLYARLLLWAIRPAVDLSREQLAIEFAQKWEEAQAYLSPPTRLDGSINPPSFPVGPSHD